MSGWTDKGKMLVLAHTFTGNALPTNFYVALLQSNTAPTNATNIMSAVNAIVSGQGYYPGGYAVALDTTDFDVRVEDASNARGYFQIKDIAWTGNGGAIPVNGNGARYAVLTNDNATQANRTIYYYWDLTSNRTVSSGQTLTLENLEVRINES